MKRWCLHGAYAGATLATFFADLSVEPAHAHLDLRPRVIEQGAVADIRLELPQLRAGEPPRRLELTGPGVAMISARRSAAAGSETGWDVRLRADAAPGVVPLVVRAVYADGKSVEVDEQLTIVPGPESSGFPFVGAVVGGLLAIAFAGVSLHLARRKA